MKKRINKFWIFLLISIQIFLSCQPLMIDAFVLSDGIYDEQVNSNNISFLVSSEIDSLYIKYEYSKNNIREYKISRGEKISGNLYWESRLVMLNPGQKARIKFYNGSTFLKEYDYNNNTLVDLSEIEVITPEKPKPPIEKPKPPVENPKPPVNKPKPPVQKPKPIRQNVNYPKSKTVNISTEIIKVDVDPSTLTDVIVNGNKIFTNLSSQRAKSGISIPLRVGNNYISIKSHRDGMEKVFNTTIKYNQKVSTVTPPVSNGTNINNLVTDKDYISGDKPIANISMTSDEEDLLDDMEQELNKDANQETDIYFMFAQDYDKATFKESEVLITGKAINATHLKANGSDILLDEKNNFKFIFNMENGINTLKLEASNEKESKEKVITLYYDGLVNQDNPEYDGTKTREDVEEEDTIKFDNADDDTDFIEVDNDKNVKLFMALSVLSIVIIILIIAIPYMDEDFKNKVKLFFKEKEDLDNIEKNNENDQGLDIKNTNDISEQKDYEVEEEYLYYDEDGNLISKEDLDKYEIIDDIDNE